ncbi:hypothetical protein D3C81_1292220 [compost metagenome]
MGAQFRQLPAGGVQFRPPRFQPGLGRRVRLALRRQLRLHSLMRLPGFGQLCRDRRHLLPRRRGLGVRGIALGLGGVGRIAGLGAQRGQLAGGGLVGRLPDGLHRAGCDLLQRLRQVGMVDGDARASAQFLPERLQHLGGRAHAALAHQAIELVGGGRDAVAEEQQAADLAIQRAGLGKASAQLGQVGLQRGVGQIQVGSGHGERKQKLTINITT